MSENMAVHHDMLISTIQRALNGRVKDMDLYLVKYELSNVKFSTKCNWTISKK